MNFRSVLSICIFGSVARSSTDSMSDRDVLIVTDDPQCRMQLEKEWSSKGWSAALYTPNRFISVIKSGSLFAQHIKNEGIIISDEGGWLKAVLQGAAMKPSYLKDARDSVYLAMPIERFRNDLMILDHPIVADLAYVSVRNFGVNHLADKGHLIFDYAKIVERIADDHALSASEVDLLMSLRAGKSSYRSRNTSVKLPGAVGELKLVLGKLFPHKKLGLIDAAATVRDLPSGYMRLRELEASVVSRLGASPTQCDLDRLGLDQTWKWVVSPQCYSWQVRHFFQTSTPEEWRNRDQYLASDRIAMGVARN